mmetsp:Transcript_4579/g.12907  ORF Transcript_4579/g.12907 Transcript_4579/m.12907 type:complete len:302 (+) Transcript_4579:2295-3200(+)|eukprot:scaffold27629_cov24-Tisochrysis_lutea.AAC.4
MSRAGSGRRPAIASSPAGSVEGSMSSASGTGGAPAVRWQRTAVSRAGAASRSLKAATRHAGAPTRACQLPSTKRRRREPSRASAAVGSCGASAASTSSKWSASSSKSSQNASPLDGALAGVPALAVSRACRPDAHGEARQTARRCASTRTSGYGSPRNSSPASGGRRALAEEASSAGEPAARPRRVSATGAPLWTSASSRSRLISGGRAAKATGIPPVSSRSASRKVGGGGASAGRPGAPWPASAAYEPASLAHAFSTSASQKPSSRRGRAKSGAPVRPSHGSSESTVTCTHCSCRQSCRV